MVDSRRAVLAAVVFVAITSFAQPPGWHHVKQPPTLAPWNPTAQETFVAYWTLEAGWSTRLEIRNNVTGHALTVTPVLRTSASNEVTLAPVTIQPEEVAEINLAQAAPNLVGKPNSYGAVVCRFSAGDEANVFASTIVQKDGTAIAFHFDEGAEDDVQDNASFESIWWLPRPTTSDYLILSNAGSRPVSGAVTLSDSVGHSSILDVHLGPNQMKRVDVGQAAQAAKFTGTIGGVSVVATHGAGNLNVVHMAFDDITGLSAIMKTFYRDPAEDSRSHSLHAPMMPLLNPDPVLNFPAGTNLNPQLLLRNATASALSASLTLDWHSTSQSGHFSLGSVSLAAGEVRQVSLSDLIQANASGTFARDAYWGTITVSYSGLAGDLVPIAVAFDSSGRYGLQTPFDEVKGKLFKGSMWHVDANRNSLITVGNAGPGPTRAALTLFYNQGRGKYTIEKPLNSGEQLWADVGQIIRNQLPDKDGNTIPIDTTGGSYELRDVDHHARGQIYEGKLVLDKTWGHGYYGCANCCGDALFKFGPSPFTNGVGNGTGDEISATNTCSYMIDDFTDDAYNWTSNDTTVATVQTAWTQLVGVGYTLGRGSVDYIKNDPRHECPDATAEPFGDITSNPVINSITPSANLWWFNGLTPSGFNTSITLSANVTPEGGSFSWSVSSGPVSLSNSSSNPVTVTGTGPSQSANDVTVSLTYTVDGNSATSSTTLSVRAPHHLQFVRQANAGWDNCNDPANGQGTATQGWASSISYNMVNNLNETFLNIGVMEGFSGRYDNAPNNWASPTAGGSYIQSGLADFVCVAGGFSPHPIPPGNPLGSSLINQISQDWYIGSSSSTSGVHVQSNLQNRYLDHGEHSGISSPPASYPN